MKNDEAIKISGNAEISGRLAIPFSPTEVHFKPGVVTGNRALAIAYVDARAVETRLDEVLGVDGWQDDYECLPNGSVVCRLGCKIGSQWITRTDVGGPSEQEDEGDRTKAAFSDALKRAAVKFAVGRYLYRLPAQWCAWDTSKRRFVSQPGLPSWAVPGLTAEQEATLIRLIGATRSNTQKLLGHFKVQQLAELTPNQYETAVRLLNRKAQFMLTS